MPPSGEVAEGRVGWGWLHLKGWLQPFGKLPGGEPLQIHRSSLGSRCGNKKTELISA